MESTPTAVAVGANLGDRETTIDRAIACVHELPKVRVTARSDLIETAPVGGVGAVDQPAYLNGAFTLQTTLTPHELLASMLGIERSLGRDRDREQRWGPRTIDLDIIFFGDLVIETDDLTVPHARMHERAFVLEPLAMIAPDWVHPTLGVRVDELLASLLGSSTR